MEIALVGEELFSGQGDTEEMFRQSTDNYCITHGQVNTDTKVLR